MVGPKALEQYLEFERFLAEFSADFIHLPPDRVDSKIEEGLQQVVEFLGVDRSTLVEYLPDRHELHVTHSYAVSEVDPIPLQRLDHLFPWAVEKIRRGEIVHFSSLDDLPEEAEADKEGWTVISIKDDFETIFPVDKDE